MFDKEIDDHVAQWAHVDWRQRPDWMNCPGDKREMEIALAVDRAARRLAYRRIWARLGRHVWKKATGE